MENTIRRRNVLSPNSYYITSANAIGIRSDFLLSSSALVSGFPSLSNINFNSPDSFAVLAILSSYEVASDNVFFLSFSSWLMAVLMLFFEKMVS
jgi:hypothetical protein